jgi:hypothetical protein
MERGLGSSCCCCDKRSKTHRSGSRWTSPHIDSIWDPGRSPHQRPPQQTLIGSPLHDIQQQIQYRVQHPHPLSQNPMNQPGQPQYGTFNGQLYRIQRPTPTPAPAPPPQIIPTPTPPPTPREQLLQYLSDQLFYVDTMHDSILIGILDRVITYLADRNVDPSFVVEFRNNIYNIEGYERYIKMNTVMGIVQNFTE